MVGIGTALALLGVWFLAVRWRRRERPGEDGFPATPWFYRAVALAAPASLVCLVSGWVTTEVGRQPWVVYRTMRTSQAVTGAGVIPVSYATLAAIYLLVAVGVAWVLRRLAATPLREPGPTAGSVQPA
jgi:cytochrome d ubiquinol oxidase subunit I